VTDGDTIRDSKQIHNDRPHSRIVVTAHMRREIMQRPVRRRTVAAEDGQVEQHCLR
jgi:hypothetical protein